MQKLPAKVTLFVVTSYSLFLSGWEEENSKILASVDLVVVQPSRLKGKQVKVLYSPAAVSLTKRSSVNHCESSLLWEGAGDGDKSENLPSMCILYLSRGLERCHRTT